MKLYKLLREGNVECRKFFRIKSPGRLHALILQVISPSYSALGERVCSQFSRGS